MVRFGAKVAAALAEAKTRGPGQKGEALPGKLGLAWGKGAGAAAPSF